MKKSVKITLLILLVLALAIGGGVGGYAYYRNTHIFVEEAVYAKDLTELDLRGTGVSVDHYESVRSQLPGCAIRWDVPFQGDFLPDDTRELTLTAITGEDMDLLSYFPELERVDLTASEDYEAIFALKQARPDLEVSYQVTIGGRIYTPDTGELSYGTDAPPLSELQEKLRWLPQVTSVHFDQPEMAAEELLSLRESYPDVSVTWVRDIQGVPYEDTLTELDLTGATYADLSELDFLREAAPYFPDLQTVRLGRCGLPNETLAAFREEMRPWCKIVWTFKIYTMTVNTDDLYFMPNKTGARVADYQLQELKYCEDMLCIDLGHQPVRKLDFLYGTPHLKYLIVADGPLLYIDPIGSLKELVYLELFMTEVNDYTPLLGCTALEDINVCFTEGDVTFFAQMPWLKTLWANNCGASKADIALLEEALPNTRMDFTHLCNYGGWRELQNYFDMRDLLGMNYNTW